MGEDDKALIVSIEAKLAKFNKEMDKAYKLTRAQMGKMEREAAKAAKKMDSSLSGAFVGLQSKIAGLAALVAGAFSVQAIRNALTFADEISDTAQRLGIGTDALQEWRFAAQEAGLEARAFDSALESFRGKIGSVIAELPRAKVTGDVLGRLGLSADDLKRAGTAEEQLRLIADALRKIDDVNIRMAIADRLGLQELVPLLAQGSEGIDAMIAKAREMGIVMDREMIEKGADAQRQVEVLALALRVQLYEALIALAPVLQTMGGGLLELAQLARQAYDLIAAIPTLGGAIEAGQMTANQSALYLATNRLDDVQMERRRLADKLAQMEEAGQSTLLGGDYGTQIVRDEIAKLDTQINMLTLSLDAQRAVYDAASGSSRVLADMTSKFAETAKTVTSTLPPVSSGLTKIGGAADKAAEKAKKAREEFEKLAARRGDRSGEIADFLSWADGVSGEQTQRDWDALGVEAYATARSNFASAFADGIMDGIQTGDWQEVLRSALAGIAEDFLRRSLENLGGALFDLMNQGGGKSGGGIGGFIAGLFGGGGGGGGGNWFSKAASVFGIGGRASGGPVSAGTPYIVGEKRPELFVPSVSGRIIPRVPDMRGTAASSNLTFAPVIDARGASPEAITRLEAMMQRQQAEFRQFAQSEPQRVTGHVRNARQRRQLRV